MARREIYVSIASVALAACAMQPTTTRAPAEGQRSLPSARLGERIAVDGPQVTPLEVLEDSRCPDQVTCVWAGRVRLKARIHLGSGDQTRELVLGEPVPVADGALELTRVTPARSADGDIAPADYRFTFRFDGGF